MQRPFRLFRGQVNDKVSCADRGRVYTGRIIATGGSYVTIHWMDGKVTRLTRYSALCNQIQVE